jgi:succinyl-CoA synthetase alpha subunit
MSILVNSSTRLLVQGITGREGTFHTEQMMEYGTKIVAGVTPGKGGTKWQDRVPMFNTVEQAVKQAGANTTIIFVPPAFAADAILEAIDARIAVIVTITEGIPVKDLIVVKEALNRSGSRMVGGNSPGIITPGQAKVGIMPGSIHKPGHCGVISRSGTLTYEAVKQLSDRGIGQSTCIGIGGDAINGSTFVDILKLFNEDTDTHSVVLIGEIGGTAEEAAADYIKVNFKKPAVAFIAGRTAPPGRRMGHAGAIIAGGKGTAAEKIAVLKAANIHVADSPADIGAALEQAIKARP